MQQHIKIKMLEEAGGQQIDVVTSLGDMVALEEKYDIAVSDMQLRQKMGWMVFLAWHAAHRTKKTPLDLVVFTAAVDSLDVTDPEDGDSEGKDEGVDRPTGLPA